MRTVQETGPSHSTGLVGLVVGVGLGVEQIESAGARAGASVRAAEQGVMPSEAHASAAERTGLRAAEETVSAAGGAEATVHTGTNHCRPPVPA